MPAKELDKELSRLICNQLLDAADKATGVYLEDINETTLGKAINAMSTWLGSEILHNAAFLSEGTDEKQEMG